MRRANWDEAKWLQGTEVWFRPIKPSANWAYSASRLAGLPSFSDDQARTALVKGIGPNGLAIRPPKHPYHLSADDANAIIGYLRSGRRGLSSTESIAGRPWIRFRIVESISVKAAVSWERRRPGGSFESRRDAELPAETDRVQVPTSPFLV